MAEALNSRQLKVAVTNLRKKVFSRERFSASLDIGMGERGLYEKGDRGDLRLEFWLESSPDGIRVTGNITGTIRMECTRCLEEYRQELDIETDEFYRRPGLGAVTSDGRQLPQEEVGEEDEYIISEGLIDLNLLVNDAVMLSLPIKRLCRDDCRGLCPHCGRNLNEGECGCAGESVDPRLEGLRALLEGDAWREGG